MSNAKAQSSNEIQSPNDKIKEEKSSCPELVEGLTFSHLTFIWYLDFVIWIFPFIWYLDLILCARGTIRDEPLNN